MDKSMTVSEYYEKHLLFKNGNPTAIGENAAYLHITKDKHMTIDGDNITVSDLRALINYLEYNSVK